jgi:hypothetical protein
MTQRSRIPVFCRSWHRTLATVALCLPLILPTAGLGEGIVTSVLQTVGLERTNVLSDDDFGTQAGLEMTPFSETEVTLQRRSNSGLLLRFGADLSVTGYPQSGRDTEVKTGIIAEATQNLDNAKVWQGQLKFEADRQVADGDWEFQRARIGARLRYQPERRHATSVRLRLGYRDQNERTFSGYDQAEYLTEISHAWRPWSDRRSLSGTAYVETRRATEDRYSYEEVGLRLAARVPIVDGTELTGRLTVFHRDYGFDAVNGQRKDTRLLGTVTLTHDMTENTGLDVFVGWDDRRSTFADRAYEGFVAGISLTKKF